MKNVTQVFKDASQGNITIHELVKNILHSKVNGDRMLI